ncbi:adenylate kinase [Helicobacter mustelae]|uniref:Adenylate kinase n=1 Tax=Helicobacter mustelae (strain ATCC 43772 / CCUG 25715 / CIP 103759 / LMG 18044 / NCTC 12198 / R85-136P) TaxID=679897 RepID=D3UHB1_HELM1|nr:adenylate kinase [Helicobacter mustelae]CBG39883.1 adenylate kinase [Helicobacter mustelae 12198]SQH71393.1 adenylate kinase [Helicobacter mustelae]STP12521.1 adenylate kinase [Helicobacter mustelae]
MKKLFLIIGAPGSGKTTDAEWIAKNHSDKIVHYSTGDLLRAETAKGTERGRIIEGFTSKGNLVPLEIVVDTILNAITHAPRDVILIDGYPRSVEQMEAFDAVLKAQDKVKLESVIEVEVSQETARDRVLGRARGEDDNAEVFHNRMKVFLEPLPAIQNFYQDILKKINGERSIEEIVKEMQEFIQSKI